MRRTRLPVLTASLAIAGGATGIFVGTAYAPLFRTDPAWLGPAVLLTGAGAVLTGLLLLPAAIRAWRDRGTP